MNIVIIGLGYVGLPLAVQLARHFPTWGIDIDSERIHELRSGKDRTNEVSSEALADSSLTLSTDVAICPPADVIIVTVPTPVDAENKPDLRPVLRATETAGSLLRPNRSTIVVYESTVYPGVTEEICGPLLERHSGLRCGSDFFLGYSPERINPGDREHTVDRITKVISGQTVEVLDKLQNIYGSVTSGGVFRAASIRVAEAAKVIENAQRDINIAFMNEITQIFARMEISIWDVLDAAKTKWNFLPFSPGLVGGHCIGVDPYYLSHRATELGHHPEIILAGRSTNDGMGAWIADQLHSRRDGRPGSALVLGLTFKENVPDLRNSKVVDLVLRLSGLGYEVTVHDPHADPDEAAREYGVALEQDPYNRKYHLVIGAVPHDEYACLDAKSLGDLIADDGLVADLKGMWRGHPKHLYQSWTL